MRFPSIDDAISDSKAEFVATEAYNNARVLRMLEFKCCGSQMNFFMPLNFEIFAFDSNNEQLNFLTQNSCSKTLQDG